MNLTHVDPQGEARMVDIGSKAIMHREAVASGTIFLNPQTIDSIKAQLIKKGDVLAAARIAAISGGKRTSDLIPLCHNIPIDRIDVKFELKEDRVDIISTASCDARTGIEMEALTAVSIAALTIYDMCKSIDKQMVISNIKLEKKTKNDVQS